MTATETVPAVEFVPSVFQEAINTFALTPVGPRFPYASVDAFVDAVAGSGKTSTLVGLVKRLPMQVRANTVVCSFGKAIAEELAKKMPAGVKSATINSLAYGALRPFVQPKGKWEADTNKYRRLVTIWFENFCANTGAQIEPKDLKEEIKNVSRLIQSVFVSLADYKDVAVLASLAAKFDLQIISIARAATCVAACIQWGWDGLPEPVRGRTFAITECFDFSEQVYYCATKNIRPWKYSGFLLVDEAQDLSPAQLAFVLKLRGFGGRFIFVGDVRQAIFAFAGADARSFEAIKAATNAVSFDLPICYRCPSSHIAEAQQIVPKIQAAPGAHVGRRAYITNGDFISDVQRLIGVQDRLAANPEIDFKASPVMVLCRTCAPLVKACYNFIAAGIPALLRGKDVGDKLIGDVDNIEKMEGYEFSKFVANAQEWLARQVHNLMQTDNNEMAIEAIQDRVDSLLAIHAYITSVRNINNAGELRDAIENLFTDNDNCKVICSTIHKAKGLEAFVVYRLRTDLLPHPMAKTEDALVQEENLRYVSLTRSKMYLTDVFKDDNEAYAPPVSVSTAPVVKLRFDYETNVQLDDDGLPSDPFAA